VAKPYSIEPVLVKALNTSPSKAVRIVEENRASTRLLQLFKMTHMPGYRIRFTFEKKPAA
jgi:hypothetical protein